MLDILNDIIDLFGIMTIAFLSVVVISCLSKYIKRVLKKQTRIKCLCRHEYKQNAAYYHNGVEYEFKCRKCGKIISIKTVTEDTFNWVKDD